MGADDDDNNNNNNNNNNTHTIYGDCAAAAAVVVRLCRRRTMYPYNTYNVILQRFASDAVRDQSGSQRPSQPSRVFLKTCPQAFCDLRLSILAQLYVSLKL
uniref:Uncharacterized protein n=1 Tax=Schizaphis graminum TaxID=13262 RepID=A0A2S2P4Q9_SCHGA